MTNSQQHHAGTGLAIHRLTLDDFAGVLHVDLDLADSGSPWFTGATSLENRPC